MAIALSARGGLVRWWEWTTIETAAQLDWLPVDYEIRDARGVLCRAVGVGVAPPTGWVRIDSGAAYAPALPAQVCR